MELIAIAAILALAALAGGKRKNGNGNGKFQGGQDDSGESKKAGFKDLNKAAGNPPNISGDPQGYNTQRWPDTNTVCLGYSVLGYDVRVDVTQDGEVFLGCPDANSKFKKSAVKKFQADYNKIAKIPGWGGIKGTLVVDGVTGKNTLNAMEAAELMGFPWQAIVAGLPPP